MLPNTRGELTFVWAGENGVDVLDPKVKETIAADLGFLPGVLGGWFAVLDLDYNRVTHLYTGKVYRLVPSVGRTQ